MKILFFSCISNEGARKMAYKWGLFNHSRTKKSQITIKNFDYLI